MLHVLGGKGEIRGEHCESTPKFRRAFKNEILLFSRDKYIGGEQVVACKNSALVNKIVLQLAEQNAYLGVFPFFGFPGYSSPGFILISHYFKNHNNNNIL